eukprot:gene31411-40803_t
MILLTLIRTVPIVKGLFLPYSSKGCRKLLSSLHSSGGVGSPNEFSIEELLKKRFEDSMQSNKSVLFSDWSIYKTSLPTITYGDDYIPLYTLRYFAVEASIQESADSLTKPLYKKNGSVQYAVKYLVSPVGTGKTCSILPMFLRTPLTHYLYIAFDNNNYRNFVLSSPPQAMISTDPTIAANQGADFMFQCIKNLIDAGPYIIECNPTPPDIRASMEAFDRYLVEKLGPGSRGLFHLDEHHFMCPGLDEESGTGIDFYLGAMRLVLETDRTVVVATDNHLLPYLPPYQPDE